jgi:hypothetical protein
MIDDRRLLEYMKPHIIRYYEDTFLTHTSSSAVVDEKDSQSYQELRRLYLKFKEK